MNDPTPQDPTVNPPADPVDPADAAPAVDAGGSGAPTAPKRRFLNRTTGALVAVGLVGALLGGGAVALAGGVGDGGDSHHGWEHHDDADRGRDGGERGPWGPREGRSFGPGGPMGGGGWGPGPQGGQQQGDQQQFGPQSGPMQGGQQQGGWGPQGMTRGS